MKSNATPMNKISQKSKSSVDVKRTLEKKKSDTIINKKFDKFSLRNTKALKSTSISSHENNIEKQKSTKIKPIKPMSYDFKSRFHLLHEKHVQLKLDFSNLTQKCKYLRRSVQELLTEKNEFISERDRLRLKYEKFNTKDDLIENLKNDLKFNTNKMCILEIELNELKKKLNISTYESTVLKSDLHKRGDECVSLKKENDILQSELNEIKEEKKSFELLISEQDTSRREMLNLIQDLKGNIRVFCRIRPPTDVENGKVLCQIKCRNDTILEIMDVKQENLKQKFIFDRVFNTDTSQEDVFLELKQLVESALDGYNICIFAYGHTGSGKTYTMQGGQTNSSLGMIPRTIQSVFESIELRKQFGWVYEIQASFLEIYNERIYDLLMNHKNQLEHEIRMTDTKGTDVYVTNLVVKSITCEKELMHLLLLAQQNCSVAATDLNEFSSRSHSITKITLIGVNNFKKESYSGSLNLVDLAGSESVRYSGISRLNETRNINKSLANLSNVILALLQNQEYIPFRNSKLTHLLMPALRGNSKTLMIVNISPLVENYNELLNSLRFASKVNKCKTGRIQRNKFPQ